MPKRPVRRNALQAKPPHHFHYLKRSKTYGGKQITQESYLGVHTTTSYAMAAGYAYGIVDKTRKGYPVVIELDVTGLKPLPDIDAVLVAENAVHNKYAMDRAKEIVEENDHISDAIYSTNDSDYGDNEDQARVGSHWTEVPAEDFNRVNLAQAMKDTYGDDDIAWEAYKKYAETGEVDEEVLGNLTIQRRWMSDFDESRVLRITTYQPIWDTVLDNYWESDDEDLEKEAKRVEAAGYHIVTLDDVANQSGVIGATEVLYEKSKKTSGEYHGTSSVFFKQAFQGIEIPDESPFPVSDPEDIEIEEEEE